VIRVDIEGDDRLFARLNAMPNALHLALLRRLELLVLKLEAKVKRDKLSGQVLNVRTGALRRSIHNVVEDRGSELVGKVLRSGAVKYAGIHEYGGTTKPHVILPKKAKALSFISSSGNRVFATKVNHPGSRMPERSFLRSSLGDMKTEILSSFAQVTKEVSGGR